MRLISVANYIRFILFLRICILHSGTSKQHKMPAVDQGRMLAGLGALLSVSYGDHSV